MKKTTHNLVKRILEQRPETRNSDMFLYTALVQHIESEKGVDITGKPFCFVLCNLKKLGLPSLESVGRARRKIQEQNPHLQSEKKVKKMREAQEEEYRKYSKGII